MPLSENDRCCHRAIWCCIANVGALVSLCEAYYQVTTAVNAGSIVGMTAASGFCCLTLCVLPRFCVDESTEIEVRGSPATFQT